MENLVQINRTIDGVVQKEGVLKVVRESTPIWPWGHKVVQAKIPISNDDELGVFQDAERDGKVVFDWRSRAARTGFNALHVDGKKPELIEEGQGYYLLNIEIGPYTDTYLPKDDPMSWFDLIAYEGWPVGKMLAIVPEMIPTEEEIQERIEQGRIRFPIGSCVDQERVELALYDNPYEGAPERLNEKELRYALTRMARKHLARIQVPQREGDNTELAKQPGLLVPARNGVVTHTNIRTGELSLLLDIEQGDVTHTAASYVSPHSDEAFYVELVGNRNEDVVANHVTGTLLKELKIARPVQVHIPEDVTIRTTRPQDKPTEGVVKVYRSVDKMLDTMGSVQRGNPAECADLEKRIRGLDGKGHIIHLDKFPDDRLYNALTSNDNLNLGKVAAVIFSKAPVSERTFTAETYFMLKGFEQVGIQVIWDTPEQGLLYFHRFGFMKPEFRNMFDRLYETNSILGLFGSATKANRTAEQDITGVINGVSFFWGGVGMVGSGGGPAIMSLSIEKTQGTSLYTCTVNLEKAEEPQAIFPDVYIPFDENNLSIRQYVLREIAGIYAVMEGGAGTNSEIWDVLVNNKLDYVERPILFIGNTQFHQDQLQAATTCVREGTMPQRVLDSIIYLLSGDETYEALCKYKGFPADNTTLLRA